MESAKTTAPKAALAKADTTAGGGTKGQAKPASPRRRRPRTSHRVAPTLDFERSLAEQGFDLIVGFDEVGRGALAGPVMVGAAAIWAKDLDDLEVPEGVADSKLLSPKRREAMFGPLRDWCAASAVGQATNVEIDEWGISCALGVAALRALKSVEDDLALAGGQGEDGGKSAASLSSASSNGLRVGAILDGPFDYITQSADMFGAPAVPLLAAVHTKVKADQSCALVSVASVVAKVTRDRLMVSIAHGNPRYEPYQWERNKGYGSAAHRAAIAEHGPTDLHRLSWHLV